MNTTPTPEFSGDECAECGWPGDLDEYGACRMCIEDGHPALASYNAGFERPAPADDRL